MPVRPNRPQRSKPKYKVILSDPAWRQSKGGKKSSRPNSSGGGFRLYNVISGSDN